MSLIMHYAYAAAIFGTLGYAAMVHWQGPNITKKGDDNGTDRES